MREKLLTVFTTGVLLLFAAGISQATPLIDTTSSWDGSNSITPFGETNTATYGQTFTVTGNETVLNSFTYYIDDYMSPDYVDFEAYVYAWDGYKATGSSLYHSNSISTTNNGGVDGFEEFVIDTGGINLISGNQYVAFFTASNLFDGISGSSKWGFNGSDAYSDGNFVYMNNGSNFDQLFYSNWNVWENDLAFSMTFTDPDSGPAPVPEPATFILLGGGLAGLAFYRRAKK